MRKPLSLSRVVRQPNMRTREAGEITGRTSKHLGLSVAAGIFLVCLFLSACSSPFGGAAPTPTSSTQALSKINWCAKSLMIFRDEGASVTSTPTGTSTASTTSTPTSTASTPIGTSTSTASSATPTAQTVSDWSLVKANLGFTVYLPTTLPNNSCLVSAQATIHDPIFGGSFTIGYLLPDHTSLSFSEAPLKSQNTSFQCNTTGGVTTTPTATPKANGTPGKAPTAAPTITSGQLCSGAKSTTNVVLSGPGTSEHLQQIFTNLQPNINWIPAIQS